jgi:phosphomannomutase
MFTLIDGTKVIARPSGTEPKIKFYVLMRREAEDLAAAATECEKRMETLVNDIVTKAE